MFNRELKPRPQLFPSLDLIWDIIDFWIDLLNWQTSRVWFMTQFKQDQYCICLSSVTMTKLWSKRSMRGTGRGGASAFYGPHNQEVNMEARKLLWRMQGGDFHWIWYLLLICGLNTDSSLIYVSLLALQCAHQISASLLATISIRLVSMLYFLYVFC